VAEQNPNGGAAITAGRFRKRKNLGKERVEMGGGERVRGFVKPGQ